MGWSFSIGRVFGSELRVHVTFFILLAWIAIGAYLAGGLPAALWNTLFIVALFACVIAHEFGHALMARRYGIKTPDITLLPIGGLARLDRLPRDPGAEIAVAVAGPAVNVVIWLVLTLLLGVNASLSNLPATADGAEGFLRQLAVVNLYLLAFNLIPAFPMDGGRVLRAVLAMRMSRDRATQMAANIGRVFAVGFGLWGLLYGNPFLVLIAAFVFIAASAESTQIHMEEVSINRVASEAMITRFVALDPSDTLQRAADAIIQTTQHEFPVTDAQGRPVGFLPRQTVFKAVAGHEHGVGQLVSDVMETDFEVADPSTPLPEATQRLGASRHDVLFIARADGRLLGYITRENLGEMMVLSRS